MHWTRFVSLAFAGLSLVSCFLPWLADGSRTLYGVETPNGVTCALMAGGQIVLAVVEQRDVRPHRALLAAMSFLSVMMLGIASLRLGNQDEELGFGAVLLFLGLMPSVLLPLAAMFIRRDPPHDDAPPHANTWPVDPRNPYAPPRWDHGPPPGPRHSP